MFHCQKEDREFMVNLGYMGLSKKKKKGKCTLCVYFALYGFVHLAMLIQLWAWT
jgi:hypothetical protein